MNNSVPEPSEAVDAVVVASSMTASEARKCIEEIKGHPGQTHLMAVTETI